MAQNSKTTSEGKEAGRIVRASAGRQAGYPKAPSSIKLTGAKVSGGGVTQDEKGNVTVKVSK